MKERRKTEGARIGRRSWDDVAHRGRDPLIRRRYSGFHRLSLLQFALYLPAVHLRRNKDDGRATVDQRTHSDRGRKERESHSNVICDSSQAEMPPRRRWRAQQTEMECGKAF